MHANSETFHLPAKSVKEAAASVSRPALARARALVDGLFRLISDDDLYCRPLPLRHRFVFYAGHVDAFDWNLFSGALPELQPFEPELDRLFAFGIDPDPTGAPTDSPRDWPEPERVASYCRRIREKLDSVWNAVPVQLRHVALEHRLMHAETLAYMLHAMPSDRLIRPAGYLPAASGRSPIIQGERCPIPAGTATLGRNPREGFGWDNEFPAVTEDVPEFSIDRFPVTNGEYRKFVESGGPSPHYWVPTDDGWLLRTMFGEVPLPLAWPVYVTHAQALAFAGWRGAALPSEAQWHRAAYGTHGQAEQPFPWGNDAPECVRGNFDSRQWDPMPVGSYPETASAFGVEDLLGNGWEWTSTPFGPFPGFEAFPFYPGYSANFFDGEHFVLKGGSPRTDAAFLRRSFRNWFRRDYPYVFATFRCVHNG
jgi:formylglycine-generating enzyme required for sulfatase activity